MKDEYLWDKSGEPDPELQRLEEVLGSLKYQPRPLEIPRDLIVVRRRRYLPYLAIAASLILALLVAGLWLRRTQDHKVTPQTRAAAPQPKAVPTAVVDNKKSEDKNDSAVKHDANQHRVASAPRNLKYTRLAKQPSKEALAAKEQLMLALRLASEKLNLAQKKTINSSTPNQIRNQHKVG
jgi:hypothetical protein